MRSEGEKLVLLEVAQEVMREKKAQSEKAEGSVQREASAPSRSQEPRPQKWVEQVLATSRDSNPSPREQKR